jgi:hypothetical protein
VDYVDGFLFEEMHLGRIGFAALGEMCVMLLLNGSFMGIMKREMIKVSWNEMGFRGWREMKLVVWESGT